MPPSTNSTPLQEPKKPGFFARLFGKNKVTPVVPQQTTSFTPPPQLTDKPGSLVQDNNNDEVASSSVTQPLSAEVPPAEPVMATNPSSSVEPAVLSEKPSTFETPVPAISSGVVEMPGQSLSDTTVATTPTDSLEGSTPVEKPLDVQGLGDTTVPVPNPQENGSDQKLSQ